MTGSNMPYNLVSNIPPTAENICQVLSEGHMIGPNLIYIFTISGEHKIDLNPSFYPTAKNI